MKRVALFFLTLFIGLGWAMAQNRTVTGTVTSSEDNEPIIGANIVVVGLPNIGATTNFDGQFRLEVPSKAKQLQFSYVGMKTQVLDIKNVMNVVLAPDAEQLETVVVVGYGSGQKLSTVSGSVARVAGEKLENKPVANVMDALQGQVAGMQVQTSSGDPTKVAEVKIHGDASLGAGGAPLYIVDGVQTSAAIVMAMNPNDFESFSVLKDASSTSIYGARAANGVIVITTKRGKKNEEGRISVNALYGISSLINERPLQFMMTGQELIDYQLRHIVELKSKGLSNVNPFNIKRDFLRAFKPGMAAFDGSTEIENGDWKATINSDYNWTKYFFKEAPTFQVDLSATGGQEALSYYISGGYFSQEGISNDPSYYNKLNIRSNVDAQVKPWLRMGVNVSGGLIERETSQSFDQFFIDSGASGAVGTPRYYKPFARDNGNNFTKEYATKIIVHPDGPWTDPLGSEDGVIYNPVWTAQFTPVKSRSYRMNLSGYAQFRPIDGLTLKSQVGTDIILTRRSSYSYPDNPINAGKGSAGQSYSNDNTITWTNTAEYKWKLKEVNDFTLLLGQEYVDNRSEGFSAYVLGLSNKDFMFLDHGRKGSFLRLPSQFRTAYAYFSLFGRLNYTFNDYFAADFTLRNDRSSRFGSKHQSATFFSVGGMFDFLRSGLIKDDGFISTLRFKANYGTQGNSAIPLYASYANTGIINYTEELAFGITSIGNDELSWERQGMLSVGVNYGMWDDKITAEVAFYNRKTSDMLMDVPLPYSTGFTSRWENVGSMTNRGVDVTLNYNFLRTKNWDAYVSGTFNYNYSRIDNLFSEKTNKEGWHTGVVMYNVGKPKALFLPTFAGVNPADGKPMWYKVVDGKNTKETTTEYDESLLCRQEKMSIEPPISGGFSMGVTFMKQLSLSTDFAFLVGGHGLNADRARLTHNTGGPLFYLNRSKDLLNEWTETNRENATAPKFDPEAKFVIDTRLVENISFLRMKNIQLSYMVPRNFLGKQRVINGIKVYVSARNLFTIVDKSFRGFDPEVASGVSSGRFPNSRQFVGGLQLMF